jgi:hypothetical protein
MPGFCPRMRHVARARDTSAADLGSVELKNNAAVQASRACSCVVCCHVVVGLHNHTASAVEREQNESEGTDGAKPLRRVRLVAGVRPGAEYVAGNDTRAQDPAVCARLVPAEEVERLHARVRPLVSGGDGGGAEQGERADSASHLEGEVRREVRVHAALAPAYLRLVYQGRSGAHNDAACICLRRRRAEARAGATSRCSAGPALSDVCSPPDVD